MSRNYKKYRSTVINLFQSYLTDKIGLDELHDGLHVIQDEFGYDRSRSLKCVWFKFSKDDTASETINSLCSHLKRGTTNNILYLRECMQIAINNPKGLQIYYS